MIVRCGADCTQTTDELISH